MKGSATDPICLDEDTSSPVTSINNTMQSQQPECHQDENIGDSAQACVTNGGLRPSTKVNACKRSGSSQTQNGNACDEGRAESAKRPRPTVGKAKVEGLESNVGSRRESRGDCSTQVPIKLFTTQLDEENCRDTVGDHSSEFCKTHATLREMLGFDRQLQQREMRWFVACSFLIDFDFLMDTVPELLSSPIAIFFYGSAFSSPEPWRRACTNSDGSCTAHFVCLDPAATPRSSSNPLPFKIEWGVHHTKMFLIGYSTYIRVIIHTANLTEPDTRFKAQGAYIQDFPLKHGDLSQSCQFQKDLLAYVDSYRYRTGHRFDGQNLRALTRELRRYDFSSAQAVLIPSIPGMHCPTRSPLGLLKLREAIRDHAASGPSSSHLVCQFSSIGSLNAKWLKEQFLSATTLGGSGSSSRTASSQNAALANQLKFVYPTVQEIRTSVEGYRGGGTVPGTTKNLSKDFLQSLYCKWSSAPDSKNPFVKSRNVPHIKSYYQLDEDNSSMKWFVLTSHNMSKAAWGEVRNGPNGRENFIAHWELGVFVSPKLMGTGPEGRLVPFTTDDQRSSSDRIRIPLPYELVPIPYGPNDRPWAIDGQYALSDEQVTMEFDLPQQIDPRALLACLFRGACSGTAVARLDS